MFLLYFWQYYCVVITDQYHNCDPSLLSIIPEGEALKPIVKESTETVDHT